MDSFLRTDTRIACDAPHRVLRAAIMENLAIPVDEEYYVVLPGQLLESGQMPAPPQSFL
jgi:hypothetical protein